MLRWRLLSSDYFILEMIIKAFPWGRAQVGGVPRAPVLAAAQRGLGRGRGAGLRGRARPVPRRAPLGPAARCLRPHERAGVLAQRARVWYARASPLWPLCWWPWRCWLCCPVSVRLVIDATGVRRAPAFVYPYGDRLA